MGKSLVSCFLRQCIIAARSGLSFCFFSDLFCCFLSAISLVNKYKIIRNSVKRAICISARVRVMQICSPTALIGQAEREREREREMT